MYNVLSTKAAILQACYKVVNGHKIVTRCTAKAIL